MASAENEGDNRMEEKLKQELFENIYRMDRISAELRAIHYHNIKFLKELGLCEEYYEKFVEKLGENNNE